MRLFFLAFLGTLLGSVPIQAQFKMGLLTGITRNSLHTSSLYRSFEQYESRGGFTIAIPLQYHFNDWFAVGVDLSYIQKNYAWVRTGDFSGIYQETKNGYVQLPFMTRFSFGGEQWKAFTNLGGYAGYWTNSRIEGSAINVFNFEELYSYRESFQFDSRRDNRLELGVLGSIGLEYAVNSSYSFFLEARYYYGLSDLQKNYMIHQVPRYNNTLTIQIGCLFNIADFF